MMLHESKENFPEEPQGFYQQGELIPGSVDIRHFRLLMTISSVNNEKMYKALEEVT
ncbi:adhesin biosynthesis transcription regulatory family protein, partial [Salmonella enterica]|uniref:adhesin biosynthesis transcription regulatory family protein n=1 Tax=Salmonella enterica TaxID=28901 RepID=UPI001C4DFF0B